MESDPYWLFTEFHQIFVRGMRNAIQHRLRSTYGDDWFHRAVLPAVSDTQRANLTAVLSNPAVDGSASLLDVGHFAHIVRWNHAAAFSDTFPEIDLVLGRLRFLVSMRNQWAHIPQDGMDLDRVVSATLAMQGILVALRCREALEVARLMNERNFDHHDDRSLDRAVVENERLGYEHETDVPVDEVSAAPLALWHTVQSYLVAEASMEPRDTLDSENEDLDSEVLVTVRVTNIAPASEDRPIVKFENVGLLVKPDRPGNGRYGLGTLAPGQIAERQFTLQPKEVAQFEYRIDGRLDTQTFFEVHQNGTLPIGIIRQVLDEFRERFEQIGISDPLTMALGSLEIVKPSMTLADASRVRQELQEVAQRIEEKRTVLGALYQEFFLDPESSLGAQVREVILLLEGLGARIQAVDDAIGATDLQEIKQAVENFEQLQMSVLRVEETIRNLLSS